MQVTFTFRNTDVGEWIKDYTTKKLAKLDRYIDKPIDVHVILSVEKFRNVAEINVTAKGVNLNGKEEAKEMPQAVDNVIDKIERQVKKHKDKIRKHKDNSSIQELINEEMINAEENVFEENAIDETSRLVETRKIVLKPMSIEDALLEIESTQSQFVVYRDISSENVSIVYRRDDGNYAMIEANS